MKLSDTFTFDADQQTVWNILMNPDAIAKAVPGVESMIPIQGEVNAWRVIAKLGIASVSGRYTGTIRMTEHQAPEQFVLTVSGEGQQSIINGSAHLQLTPDQETGKTIITWKAEADVSGKLASIAQRLIVSVASLLSKQFFQSLQKQLKAEEPS